MNMIVASFDSSVNGSNSNSFDSNSSNSIKLPFDMKESFERKFPTASARSARNSGRSSVRSSLRSDCSNSNDSSRDSGLSGLAGVNPISTTNVVAIVSINRTGEILFSNAKAHSIFECEGLTGRLIHDFVPESFREKHIKMINNFFDKQYVGERLDPDTIIRASLESGKQVPLHLALETKVDFVTRKPSLVVAFITEATTIIEMSKVEKMLSRATLVVLQQFISQTIMSSVSAIELLYTNPLKYEDAHDDETKLDECREYSYKELSNGKVGSEDEKMLFFIVTSALTILIATLPLFVNRGQAQDGERRDSWFRHVANGVNDIQDYLSNFQTFRSVDLVGLTTLASMVYLYLFFALSVLPQEYELNSVKQCEDNINNKFHYTIALSIVGLLPALFLSYKASKNFILNGSHGLFEKMKYPQQQGGVGDIEAPVVEYSKRKKFHAQRRNTMKGIAEDPIFAESLKSMDMDIGVIHEREMDE